MTAWKCRLLNLTTMSTHFWKCALAYYSLLQYTTAYYSIIQYTILQHTTVLYCIVTAQNQITLWIFLIFVTSMQPQYIKAVCYCIRILNIGTFFVDFFCRIHINKINAFPRRVHCQTEVTIPHLLDTNDPITWLIELSQHKYHTQLMVGIVTQLKPQDNHGITQCYKMKVMKFATDQTYQL